MARLEMLDIIDYTMGLLGQKGSDTPFTNNDVEDSLDQWRLDLEWVLLDTDPDYRRFYTRPFRFGELLVRDRELIDVTTPDFSQYKPVRFLSNDVVLRDDRFEGGALHTPDDTQWISGTFTFSTPPNKSLYIYGTAYNAWHAAADLLSLTPDDGRRPVKTLRIGNTTRTYGTEGKVKDYRRRGNRINQRLTRLYRS